MLAKKEPSKALLLKNPKLKIAESTQINHKVNIYEAIYGEVTY